MKTNKK